MVSIIITTYNGGKTLQRAIESSLQQSYQDIEVVVVDDNAPKSSGRSITERIMQNYKGNDKVIYVKHSENKNGAVARNTGIAASHGEYITFLDDDDYYMHDRVEKLVHIMENDTSIDGVCTSVIMMFSGYIVDVAKSQIERLHVRDLLIDQGALGTGSNIFLKASSVKEVNGFDETFLRNQDVEFMIRIAKKFNVIFIKDLLVVKDVSCVRKLDYKKNKTAFAKFDSKFHAEIATLSDEDKFLYKSDRARCLFYIAAVNSDKSAFLEEYNALKQIGCLSKKEYIEYKFYRLYFLYLKLKHSKFMQVYFAKLKYVYNDRKERSELPDFPEIHKDYFNKHVL